MVSLDRLTLGAAAGAATNMVVGGIGARLAMRVVVLLIGGQPAVTFEGTVGILVLAAILGTVLGAAVALVHGWAGSRWRRADWLLGGLLTLLVAGMFLTIRDGEAALLPAWPGAAALCAAGAVEHAGDRLCLRTAVAQPRPKVERQAPAVWLGDLWGCICVSIRGHDVVGRRATAPAARLHGTWRSWPARARTWLAAYAPMQMLGFVFALVYLLLTWLLFWLAEGPDLRLAAIGLLLLAAGSFHVIGPLESVLGRGCRQTHSKCFWRQ